MRHSSDTSNGGYEVHNSTAIANAFRELQKQATEEGRGEELLRAARAVYDRLRHNPSTFGEPLYRLPALRGQVRCAAIRPLAVDFLVCDDRPIVFIKAVKLLPRRER